MSVVVAEHVEQLGLPRVGVEDAEAVGRRRQDVLLKERLAVVVVRRR